MMRTFKLKNAMGYEFDLMRKDAFFSNPAGLGFGRELEFIVAGNAFLEIEANASQKSITAEMVFAGYEQYKEFAEFIAYEPLTLCYMPLKKWHHVDCKVELFEKGEILSENRRLICTISLLCFTKWYLPEYVGKTETAEGIGKIYPYTYPYVYAETRTGEVILINNGTIASPCRIHIMGHCENPTWALFQGNTDLCRGGVFATIPAGNKLVIDSDPTKMEITEYTVGNILVQNLYQDSDFSKPRFVYAPPGESRLVFSHDGTGTIDAFIEVRQLADAV